MEFIINTIRTLFYSLDKVIYGLIDDVYGLLLQLTRTSVFSQQAIHEFAQRIYALIGIFMLFKVTVSLINYVLNPDEFIDKDKGFASIIKHVILALVMIVLVPYIFNEAYEVQSIILEENTIMNLVFGSPSGRSLPNSSYTEQAGQKIQFTIMYAFAQPNYEEFYNDNYYDLSDCYHTYDTYPKGHSLEGEYMFRATPVFGDTPSTTSRFIYELEPSCFGKYNPDKDLYEMDGQNGQLLKAFNDSKKVSNDEDASMSAIYQNYAQGIAQQSFNMFFRKEVILARENREDGRYLINYKFGISTAVGVGVLYLFLMFCIDIAVRSVKLGFLQMIAPIPILSYVDPKSGKDGMFKKWTDMCVKTYLELFMRLFALYFGIYVISLIGTFRDVTTGEIVSGWIVSLFMIIGVLIFVKKLPEILKEVLNIKSDGKFTFNPLKKLNDEMFGAKRIAGVGAAGLAGAAAFGTNLIANKGNPFSAMAGAASATGRGLLGAARGEKFGKNFSNSYGGAMKARRDRDDRQELGINALDIASQRARQAMGITTPDKIQDVQLKRYDEAIKYAKAAKSRAESEVDKKADKIWDASRGATLGALRDRAEAWKNMDAKEYATSHGISEDDAIKEITNRSSQANAEYFAARKAATNKYISAASSGRLTDAGASLTDSTGAAVYTTEDVQVRENVQHLTSTVSDYRLTDSDKHAISVNPADIGTSIDGLESSKASIEGSDEFRRAHLVAEQTTKQK